MINHIVEPSLFELQLEDLHIEEMRFILNCPNYLYMDPTLEFHIHDSRVIATIQDLNLFAKDRFNC